jgi:hypothetical protein
VLHEFLQVEAFAKFSNAIGKVGSNKGKSFMNATFFWLFDT